MDTVVFYLGTLELDVMIHLRCGNRECELSRDVCGGAGGYVGSLGLQLSESEWESASGQLFTRRLCSMVTVSEMEWGSASASIVA